MIEMRVRHIYIYIYIYINVIIYIHVCIMYVYIYIYLFGGVYFVSVDYIRINQGHLCYNTPLSEHTACALLWPALVVPPGPSWVGPLWASLGPDGPSPNGPMRHTWRSTSLRPQDDFRDLRLADLCVSSVHVCCVTQQMISHTLNAARHVCWVTQQTGKLYRSLTDCIFMPFY